MVLASTFNKHHSWQRLTRGVVPRGTDTGCNAPLLNLPLSSLALFGGLLSRHLGGLVLKGDSLHLHVHSFSIYNLCFLLYYSSLVGMSSLADLVVTDYPSSPLRFEVTYAFVSHQANFRLFAKLFSSSLVFSIGAFYPNARWLEREIWDLYGVSFVFHPDLRRILTDYGFRGYPLRKDFPLAGYVEVRYDDTFASVLAEPVEFAQSFRSFRFGNPWVLY